MNHRLRAWICIAIFVASLTTGVYIPVTAWTRKIHQAEAVAASERLVRVPIVGCLVDRCGVAYRREYQSEPMATRTEKFMEQCERMEVWARFIEWIASLRSKTWLTSL